MFPCLSSGVMCSSCLFQGTKQGVAGRQREGAAEKAAQLAVPRALEGPRAAQSGESRTLKDDKGQLEKWRTLWTAVNSERHRVMFSVLSFSHLHNHQSSYDSLQVGGFFFYICMKCIP